MNTFQATIFVTGIEHKTVGDKDRKLAIVRGAVRQAGDFDTSANKRKDGFISVEVWGAQAEFIEKYVKEKSAIEVQGKWFVHQWTDEQTGKGREAIKWVADGVSFAPQGKAEGGANDGGGAEDTGEPTGNTSSAPAAATTAPAARDPFAI